jgi:Flp pilus assembly protein TadD
MAEDPATIEQAARFYQARDLPRTEAVCRTILARQPDHFDARHLLGVVCTQSGRHAEAVQHLAQASRLRPRHAQVLFNLGNAHQGLDDHEPAIEAYRQALRAAPNDPGALNNLGTSLRALKRLDAAIDCYRTLLAVAPDYAPAHNNLASVLRDADRLAEAEHHFRQALATAPPDTPAVRLADVVNGLGQVLMELGRHQEALAICQSFRAAHPDQAAMQWNESLVLLLQGRYREGWTAYEARWLVPEHDRPHPDARVLDPAAVAGQRVLVTTEQGRGDMIQFARYLPMLARRGAAVTFSTYPDLVALMTGLDGVQAVVSADDPDPAYDQRTSLLSLPLAFGTDADSIPAAVPYLRIAPERRAAWRQRLAAAPRPRVGLCWWGSQHLPLRSMPLATLAPVLARGDVAFHALQKDIEPADRTWIATRPEVADHTGSIADFADTAGLIAAMDLVITIDTAVAHLAGALGRPTWVMLPFNADWRWLLDRADCPWYPTVRLFRQTRRGDWGPVVAQVAQALRDHRFDPPNPLTHGSG